MKQQKNNIKLSENLINNYDEIMINFIKKNMKLKNYDFFEVGNYNFNLIAIRNKTNLNANLFNDNLFVIFKNDFSEWELKRFKITTDAGLYYRRNLANVNGFAIVKPGQYKSVFKLGLHKGEHPALVQNKPIDVYRDKDLNGAIDIDKTKVYTGMFGIDMHSTNYSNIDFKDVNKWSAGCQVFQSQLEFEYFLELMRRQKGNTYSYTLFSSDELVF